MKTGGLSMAGPNSGANCHLSDNTCASRVLQGRAERGQLFLEPATLGDQARPSRTKRVEARPPGRIFGDGRV